MFVGAFATDSPEKFKLGAFGSSEAVFKVTARNMVTPDNGVDWYFDPNDSMGFAPADAGINQFMHGDRCGSLNIKQDNVVACRDSSENDLSARRMSWSLNPTVDFGGYRLGTLSNLHVDGEHMKAIYLCEKKSNSA